MELTRSTKLPRAVLWVVVGICVAPYLANLVGVSFASTAVEFNTTAAFFVSEGELIDQLHHSLAGSFTHTILEWTAFCAAIFTATLALLHFGITRDVTTPIIGVALFCAGCMDAFHTLAADRLIDAVADNQDLIPFTWVLCRMFNVTIMMAGIVLILLRGTRSVASNLRFVLISSVVFGVAAYITIYVCANSTTLPKTQFPDSLITRPYDIVPMGLFLIAGMSLYRRIHRRSPSLFTHALVISVIPEVATQAYVAFGSSHLFDNGFNIAHFLKIIAYLVPFCGLCFDYIVVYKAQASTVEELQRTQVTLAQTAKETARVNQTLVRKNEELDEFTHVASHDLQEPLRKLTSFSELLREDVGAELSEDAARDLAFIEDAAHRMNRLVKDLLELSRSGRSAMSLEQVDLDDCVQRALEALAASVEESAAEITCEHLGGVAGDAVLLGQIFQNLIGNAIKFRSPDRTPVIRVTVERRDGIEIFGVKDNGIGIKAEYAKQIFAPFKRLHGRSEYEGTGIGLAICRKAVARHGGRLWVESTPGGGSHFRFTLHEKAVVE